MTYARTKQIRLYNKGGPIHFNEGGLAAAEEVRQMGRGDDEVLIHVSPEEFEALVGMWGEPDINPNTGMPEYGFLSKLWKKVKGVVKKAAPMLLNAFIPGAGTALTALGGLTGSGGGGGGIPGATPGIAGPMGAGGMGPPAPGSGVMGPPAPPAGGGGGFLSQVGDWIKNNPALATGAGVGLLGILGSGRGETTQGPPGLPPEFTESLPQYDFNRQQQQMAEPSDYYTYGQVGAPQAGEFQFWEDNTIGQRAGAQSDTQNSLERMLSRLREPPVAAYAGGGYARGAGSGREDTIEAMLSDGEYVMDAETVSMLGDGSNEHGAQRLDEMRENLRKHKGAGLSKGKFSADAKQPMQYLAKGGVVKALSGNKRGFERWVTQQGGDPLNSFAWKDSETGRYEVQVSDLDMYWYGVADNANEARRLAMQEFQKRIEAQELASQPVKKARGGRVKNRMLARRMRKLARGET